MPLRELVLHSYIYKALTALVLLAFLRGVRQG